MVPWRVWQPAFKMAPTDGHLLIILPYLVPFTMNKSGIKEKWQCVTSELGHPRHCSSTLVSSVSHSRGSQQSCCEDTQVILWRGHVKVNWGLPPTAQSPGRLCLWKCLLQPQQGLQMTSAPADIWLQLHEKSQARITQPNCSWIPDPQKLWK